MIGKGNQVIAMSNRIIKIDRLNPLGYFAIAMGYFWNGQFELALEMMSHKTIDAIVSNPDESSIWLVFKAYFHVYTGDTERAEELLKPVRWTAQGDIGIQLAEFLRTILQAKGEHFEEIITRQFEITVGSDPTWSIMVATFYAMLNLKDDAIIWAEKAASRGFINYPYLSQHDPYLAKLRGETRYEDLLKKVKREWENLPTDI